jgi:class 3 adenylate cyclase
MFTDFKNFTRSSEEMSAEELVKIIHYYFSEFDRIISRHNIEKIKIIGDSYMCAGGLPAVNDTHAFDVVLAALELQDFMAAQKQERMSRNEMFFELRIGIHTGNVVAGIVGTKKFAYDIWGDTVNTASRMESSGEPGKVNISGTTYERIKDHFICTHRGKVTAKNKGEVDMYFVHQVTGRPGK